MDLELQLDLINDGIAHNLDGKIFKNIEEIEGVVSRKLRKEIRMDKPFELLGKQFILMVWTRQVDNWLEVVASMLVEFDGKEEIV